MHPKGLFPVKWSIHLSLPTKVFPVCVVKWVTTERKVSLVEEVPPKANSESFECMKLTKECSHDEEGKGEGSRSKGELELWYNLNKAFRQSHKYLWSQNGLSQLFWVQMQTRTFSKRARPWATWLSSAKGSSWRGLEAKAVSQHLSGQRLSVLKGGI